MYPSVIFCVLESFWYIRKESKSWLLMERWPVTMNIILSWKWQPHFTTSFSHPGTDLKKEVVLFSIYYFLSFYWSFPGPLQHSETAQSFMSPVQKQYKCANLSNQYRNRVFLGLCYWMFYRIRILIKSVNFVLKVALYWQFWSIAKCKAPWTSYI